MSKTITINLKALQDSCLTQPTIQQVELDTLQERLVLSLGDVSKPARSKSLMCGYSLGLYAKKVHDFKVNGLFYELEGFDITKNSNPVTTLKKMLSRGLKQSNRIIIKDCGVTRSFIERNIKNRVYIDKQDIQEVWLINDKGKLEIIYNAKTP